MCRLVKGETYTVIRRIDVAIKNCDVIYYVKSQNKSMTDDNNRNMEKENKEKRCLGSQFFNMGLRRAQSGKLQAYHHRRGINSIVSFVFCTNLFAFTMLNLPKSSIFVEILGSF